MVCWREMSGKGNVQGNVQHSLKIEQPSLEVASTTFAAGVTNLQFPIQVCYSPSSISQPIS